MKMRCVFQVKSEGGTISYEVQYDKAKVKKGEDADGSREYDILIVATPLGKGAKTKVGEKVEPRVLSSFFSDLLVPRRTYVCDRFQFARPWAATFRFRGVCACRHDLSVSGPLDFRLVIQVLLSPCMILNACVRRLHPCLTSLAEDRGSK